MISGLPINYIQHKDLVRSALGAGGPNGWIRAVTFRGERLSGKSTLLDEVERIARESSCVTASIDFSFQFDPHAILDHLATSLARKLGNRKLARYLKLSRRSVETQGISIRNTVVMNSSAVFHSIQDSRALNRHLTSQFFEDIGSKSLLNKPKNVLIFDGFEKATPETMSWMEQDFAHQLNNSDNCVVVVAGTCLPNLQHYLKDACVSMELGGIALGDWISYVNSEGLGISIDNVIQIHRDSNGLPGVMLPLLTSRDTP